MQKKSAFFKEALKNIKTSGTVTPSSRFLVKKLIEDIDFKNTSLIVELGPGNGVITKQLLKKMGPNAKLICFEINDIFYNSLKELNDERLLLLKASAEYSIEELKKLNITKVDVIISSLPLSIIPKEVVLSILEKSKKLLKKDGYFIQFQYSTKFYTTLKNIFDTKNVKLTFELMNFPPAFIYKCIK